jgi:hypothetical protein
MWRQTLAWIVGVTFAIGVIGSCNVVLYSEPSALFGYNTRNNSLRDYEAIILSFHDREDLVRYMGGGISINVQSGRDSNVAVSQSSSKSDACFISAMRPRKDETYIL